MTYNYESGTLKMYLNGNEVTSIAKNLDTNMIGVALANIDKNVFLGTIGTGGANLSHGSRTMLHQIYNIEMSAEQILWNYNNIKPDGV